MARLYLLQSWTNAAEEDYKLSAGYSGEQIGRRGGTSRQVHTIHRGRQWFANLDAYKEEERDKKKSEDCTIEYKLFPQQKKLDELDKLYFELEQNYRQGKMDNEQYCGLFNAIERKREKEWKSLAKAKGWDDAENMHQSRIIEWEDALYTALALVFYGLGISYIIYIMTL